MTKPKEAEVRLKRKRDYNREWMREYQRKNPLTEEQKRLKREYAKNHYYKNKKRLNKQSSDYMKSPRGKEINKKRRLNNLEKHKCRDFINHAIRDGKIEKFPCSVCGNIASEGHHEDYTKPLEVIWLCRKHHTLKHAEIKKLRGSNE